MAASDTFFGGLEGLLMQLGQLGGQVVDSGVLQQMGLISSGGGLSPIQGPITAQQASLGGLIGPVVGGAAGALGVDALINALTGGGQSVVETGPGLLGGSDGTFTKDSSSSRRWATEVVVNDEELGMRVFRNMGRPVLYSGDLAACRRTDKVAKRAARARRRPR